jgi:hypothetical protein
MGKRSNCPPVDLRLWILRRFVVLFYLDLEAGGEGVGGIDDDRVAGLEASHYFQLGAEIAADGDVF